MNKGHSLTKDASRCNVIVNTYTDIPAPKNPTYFDTSVVDQF